MKKRMGIIVLVFIKFILNISVICCLYRRDVYIYSVNQSYVLWWSLCNTEFKDVQTCRCIRAFLNIEMLIFLLYCIYISNFGNMSRPTSVGYLSSLDTVKYFKRHWVPSELVFFSYIICQSMFSILTQEFWHNLLWMLIHVYIT